MKNRFKSVVCVDLMLVKSDGDNKRVLLAKRKNTGSNDGEYELPGGHLEDGEDLFDAMIRESKEELNIDLKREDLKIINILHHYSGGRLNFIFSAENVNTIPKIAEPDKCDELKWVNIDKLPKDTMDKVSMIINNIKSGKFYDVL